MKAEVRKMLEDTERSYWDKSCAAMKTDKDKASFYAAYAAGIHRAAMEILIWEERHDDAE